MLKQMPTKSNFRSNGSFSAKLASRSVSLFLVAIAALGSSVTMANAEPIAGKQDLAEKQDLQRTKQVRDTDFSGLFIILAARFKIKPEKREEFLTLANEAIALTQEEPGVVSYNLYEDPTDPNSFIFFEQWKSRKSLDVHLATDYTVRLLDRFGSLVDGEPSTKVYRIQSVDFVLD